MSEGAQNVGDEHAVVGEPVSEPHQAAVVGEPPEEITPVLGEPVLLANGAQKDQQPVASPSLDESATNGILENTPPASQVSSQSTDVPSTTVSSLEGPSPSAAEDQNSSEGATVEEGMHRSATETPIPPEPSTEASESPTLDNYEAKTDTEIPADTEIAHITDVPTEPPPPQSEITFTENPYSALDEDSQDSVKDTSKEELPATDRLLDDAPLSSEANKVFADTEGLGVATAESPTAVTTSPVAHEEPEKGFAADSQEFAILSSATSEALSSSKEGSVEIKAAEPNESDELSASEQKQLPVSTQDSSGATSSLEETDLGSASHPVNNEDAKVQEIEKVEENSVKSGLRSSEAEQVVSREDDKIEEDSAKPGTASTEAEQVVSKEAVPPESGSHEELSPAKTEDHAALNSSHLDIDLEAPGKASLDEVEHVVNREAAAQPEVFSNEKMSVKEGGNLAVSVSSQGQSDNKTSSEVSLTESSATRAISSEEFSGDQKVPDETALGENGFQHDQDSIPLETEQGVTKDDSGSAEGIEKPTSRAKIPFIFTTLAIAVVGVAVATFSRSRQ